MATRSSYSSGTNGQTYTCPHCGGSGTVNDSQGNPKTCTVCYGKTFLSYAAYQKYMNSQPLATIPDPIKLVDCPECGATAEITDPNTGRLIDCPLCKATGHVTEDVRKKWLEDNSED